MAIELNAETRKHCTASIRRFFEEQLDQDIGDLKAALVLDFVLREIGPSIHNAAVEQAQAFLRDRVADLDGACGEAEFAYWPRSAATRRRPG